MVDVTFYFRVLRGIIIMEHSKINFDTCNLCVKRWGLGGRSSLDILHNCWQFCMCVISLFWERNLTFASSNNYSFLKVFFVWKRKVGYLLGVFYEGVLTELCLCMLIKNMAFREFYFNYIVQRFRIFLDLRFVIRIYCCT